ncbi:MAG: DUF5131 family protein [Candidatus Wallbacteria bacterium]|nr:DUF5131 family protein [Candidatus Wallbacteria bacterium]
MAPAAVRFLSIEPLLEDLGVIDLSGVHWVIVGGESGAGATPMKREWVLPIRDPCQAAGVPFFLWRRSFVNIRIWSRRIFRRRSATQPGSHRSG